MLPFVLQPSDLVTVSTNNRHTLDFEGSFLSPSTVVSGTRYRVTGEHIATNSTIQVDSITSAASLRSQRSSGSKRWTNANRTIVLVLVHFTSSSYQPTPSLSAVTDLFWTGTPNIAAYFNWVSQV
jgi:hypothetical protein